MGAGLAQENPDVPWRDTKLTRFNASVSTYDIVAMYGVPPDFSEGALDFRYVTGIDDKRLNDLLIEGFPHEP